MGRIRRVALLFVAAMAMVVLSSTVALAGTKAFTNSSPMPIADSLFPDAGLANPYPSHIEVQNLSGNITDVNLKLSGFSHTFPDDVDVLLVGPQGQKALLMSDVGGDDFGNITDVSLTLDDEATNPLPDNPKITSGAYKPTQGTITSVGGDSTVPANFPAPAPPGPYATNLSAFDNTDPNGTWDLYVIDDTQGDEGQFAGGWSLAITTDSPDSQPDTQAPTVFSTNPSSGATNVNRQANVSADFSEEMNQQSINSSTFELQQFNKKTKKWKTIPTTITLSPDHTTATLDPFGATEGATEQPLGANKKFRGLITTGVEDLASNPMANKFVWTFRTVSN